MQYYSKELADQGTNRYLGSIRAFKKGKDKKVAKAHEDLTSRLTDPEQSMLRRLWWGPSTWERFLGGLEEAVATGEPRAMELLSAYREAWAKTQEDWDRWHDHFRLLRGELRDWLVAAGRKPVPVDLSAKKPPKEIRRAEAEFLQQPAEQDDHLRVRMVLALALDPTVQFDVEWGQRFDEAESQRGLAWPWDRRWPHDFEGMGEWLSGENLLGTVVRLLDGRGSILTGHISSVIVNPGALMQSKNDTQIIVCDDALLVLQRGGLEYTPGEWNHIDTYSYRHGTIVGKPGKERLEITLPGGKKPVFWTDRLGLRPSVFDTLLERVSHAGTTGV